MQNSSLHCPYFEVYYFLFCYITKLVHFILASILEYYSIFDD